MTFFLTKHIIDSVKEYPVLYDPKHADYRDTKKNDEVWDEIGKKLNQDADYLKLKWKNIKHFYARHLESLITTGPFKRRWPWTRKMEFFRPYLKLSSAEPNEPRKAIAFEQVTIVSDDKEIENNKTFFNENEDVAYDCYETDLQNQIEERRTEEDCTEIRQPNFCDDIMNEKEMDTSTFSDSKVISNVTVVNEEENIADECCETASQDTREERQAQEETSESHPSRLDNFMSYLGNTENNPLVFNDDAIDLLFLGLAECVKTFSSKRQAITKLKIANIVLEQEVQQQKNDLNSSLGLKGSSPTTKN